MGNSHSQQTSQAPTEVVRRPPIRPNAPPSARPISELGPKGPSYHSPENMVLPKDIPVMKLRPVSMELSKFHPEYKELFNYGDEEENVEDKENMVDDDNDDLQKLEKLGTSPPRPPPPILKNGSVSNGNVKHNMPLSSNITMNHMPNGNVGTGTAVSSNVNNIAVNANGKANVPYRPSHRRQISLGQEQHVIMEEPEENIDSRMKLDPLMQSFPGATGPSLPVKNNFNLDYSYQLTYAQLAEHRRNKTIEDLEKKTGKKVSDLSADLNENQEQPFKRAAPSRISSKSTGSGGSALSSKKKKAPAPPGESAPEVPVPPPPPFTGTANTLPFPSKNKVKIQNQPYSIENEPPADYETDSPRKEVGLVLPRYKVISRDKSAVSQSTPLSSGNATSTRKSAPVSRNNSLSMGKPEIILKRTPSLNPVQKDTTSADEEVPWLLQIKNLSETMSARRQQSMESSDTPELSKETKMETDEEVDLVKVQTNLNPPQTKMIFESSTTEFKVEAAPEEEKIDANSDTNKEVISQEEKEKALSPKLTRHASTLGFEQTPATTLQRQSSEPSSLSAANQADPVRRLNSLLQHDIKAAANAKCHKLKKQVTPVPPKPKDPHEVFREQLAKACAQRDERVKLEGTIDEKLKQTDQDTLRLGKVKETSNERKDSTTSSEAQETLPKPPRYHKNIAMNRNTSIYDRRQASQNKASNHRASTALDWTPEDDLDSDDNLSDRETVTGRKASSDGFKSTIVPKNVSDLKGKKKTKKEKKTKMTAEDDSSKQKLGSVKKFKKSMHKSVRNAFGSISKASGRLLRKQRAEDLEQVDDVPKSWKPSHTDVRPNKSKASGRTKISMIPHNDVESDSEGEKVTGESEDFDETKMKENEPVNSEEETSEDDSVEDSTIYKNKTSSASAKKLTAKEQKYVYDSEEEEAVAKYRERKIKQMKEDRKIQEKLEKERESATLNLIEEARERERKLEAERRKQLEMELELHKIREAETRERLQRLENAHLQQQLNAHLIHQQQQNMSMQLSAPPLPPAGNFNQNYGIGPEAAQAQTFTNLFGTQIPQNGYQTNYGLYHPTQTGSMLNGTVPGVTYDINDYMRMLGVQTPPTSQQMAYFLNSVTLTGQPFERKSNPTLMDVINQQDPMKQYMTGHVNYQLPEATTKKQGFQNWASTPNINLTSASNTVPMTDFVPSYSSLNGANTQDGNKDKQKVKSRNPLYNSDDSDEGLSPHRTVIRARVDDFRKLPVRTESGKFMRQYGSNNYISKQNDSNIVNEQSDKILTNGLSQADNIDTGHEDRVSPSNSTSTFDSAITSPSVTLSTPSSPSRSVGAPASPMVIQRSGGNGGFRTILDCTTANSNLDTNRYVS